MLTSKEIDATARQLLDAPPAGLAQFAADTRPSDLSELARRLNSLAQHAALVAAYLEERGAYGTDAGHKKALDQANRTLKRIRKAMGFSYPDRGAVNF